MISIRKTPDGAVFKVLVLEHSCEMQYKLSGRLDRNPLTNFGCSDKDWFAKNDAGWSSLVARRAHNPKVRGSNPLPATNKIKGLGEYKLSNPFFMVFYKYMT